MATLINQFHALVDNEIAAGCATAQFVEDVATNGECDSALAEFTAWMKGLDEAGRKAQYTRYQYTAAAVRLLKAAKEGKLPPRPAGNIMQWDAARRPAGTGGGTGGGKKAMTDTDFVLAFGALSPEGQANVIRSLKRAYPDAFKASK